MKHSFCIAFVLFLFIGYLQAADTPAVIELNAGLFNSPAALSPDGKKIVTIVDQGFSSWDIESGKELQKLEGRFSVRYSAAFSPDGKMVATAGYDGTRIWDVESGKELHGLGVNPDGGHSRMNFVVAFSPDGKKIADSDAIWDIESGKELHSLRTGQYNFDVVFSPDGKEVITGSGFNGAITIWDVDTGRAKATLNAHPDRTEHQDFSVKSVVFSPDGKKFATAHRDGIARIWDAESTEVILELRGHVGWNISVDSVAFSPDGTKIVTSAANDYTARIWDAGSGKELQRLEGYTNVPTDRAYPLIDFYYAMFSRDGKNVLTSSRNGIVRIWDLERVPALSIPPPSPVDERPVPAELVTIKLGQGRCFSDHYDITPAIAISPDGKKIVTASDQDTAQVWDVESGKGLLDLVGHEDPVTEVAFSPDGTKIATYGYDGTTRIWDTESGKELHKLSGGFVASFAFSPDGTKLVVDKQILDVESGKELQKLEGGFIAFSSDGKKFVTRNVKNTRIWNTESGEELQTLTGKSVALFPDGKRIVMMNQRNIQILDVESGKVLQTLQYGYSLGNNYDWGQIAISPDGKRIVSMNSRTVRISDPESGKVLATYGLGTFLGSFGYPSEIFTTPASFSPDGKRIVVGSQILLGTADEYILVRIWDAETGEELQPLRGRTSNVFFAAFLPCGKKVISASDGAVRIWTLE